MNLDLYLDWTGLRDDLAEAAASPSFAESVRRHQTALQALLTPETLAATPVAWRFRVPELGEGGACSLFGQLAELPYELAGILGGQGADNQRLLAEATVVTRYYREHSRSHWFGVYQTRRKSADESVLVKLAYFGAESRAEFPLTEAFAQGSNNSAVGLSGRARLINDVAAFVAEGGGYYTCDPKVKAEACLPLFDADRRVVGILDSEAFDRDFFGGDELALVIAVALTLSGGLIARPVAALNA